MAATTLGRAGWLLAREFVRREVRLRYLGTVSGAAWALAQPLLQLAIYGYVFLYVFRARLPEAEFGGLGFLPFLAVGLWPWTAFAEALNRAVSAVPDNAGLLGKVALPRPLLVFAPVCASFLLHALGFAAVLAVLWLGGWLTPRWQVLQLPVLFVALGLFTLGLAWAFAALNVYVRDFAHLLTQVITLLFFLTPVLYPRSLIPEAIRPIADANPMALYVGLFRQASLGVGGYQPWHFALAVLIACVVAWLGYITFKRLAPYFEDFL